MTFRLTPDDASVEAALRRIATEQIDKALAETDAAAADLHARVHAGRKRCKKLRVLVRLVRPVFPGYRQENAALRDAARGLSELRDATGLIETYDALVAAYADQVDRGRLGRRVRRALTAQRGAAVDEADAGRRMASFREALAAARRRAGRWQVDAEGFEALEGGLARTYGRARAAMDTARKSPRPETMHQWRKRVKYHGHHARLLRPVWRAPMKAHRDAAEALADLLGDHHDLAVFRAALTGEPDTFGTAADVELLVGMADRRAAAMEAEAFVAGTRVLAEPEAALAHRWSRYWRAWQRARTVPRRAALVA